MAHSGEWFGYARMSGPIFSTRRLSSPRDSATPLLKSTIPEGAEVVFSHILPDSEVSRRVDSSPAMITPSGGRKTTTPVASPLAKKVLASASAPPSFLENLHIPEDAFVPRRADTFDPKHLVKVDGPPIGDMMEKSASIDIPPWASASQSGIEPSAKAGSISPQERNAMLEKREETLVFLLLTTSCETITDALLLAEIHLHSLKLERNFLSESTGSRR